MKVELRYGFLMDTLEEQVNEQGFTFGDNSDLVEELRESYNMLRFYLNFTDKQINEILEKLNKEVISYLKSLPKKEINK